MQLLKTQFTHDGFTYQQIDRSDTAAIYSQGADSYEVVRIRISPAECLFGKDFPERECYPPTSAWGTSGWTYSGPTGLEDARKRFESLHCEPLA